MKYDGYQVGIVIKSLRIQRNLTKEALAAELGISVSTIKKYENVSVLSRGTFRENRRLGKQWIER